MEYILNAAEAAKIDSISIQEIKIPSVVLMEKAAMAVMQCIKEKCIACNGNDIHNLHTVKILAVCGMGNNGGDGVACARMFKEAGFDASILLVGNKDKATEEMQIQIDIAKNLNLRFITKPGDNEYNIIIDALFGTGLSRNIEGEYLKWVNWINSQPSQVVSVDIPSGINADNGHI